ncbi:MAG TPA: hypothetical protein PKA82_14405 [Pyrinomonadaceae bacterium]|nr:hypothetical protein [Pyrinomonadaceae bacterium]
MEERGETARTVIWASVLLIITLTTLGVLYASGILRPAPSSDKKIDVDINVPSAPAR